MPGEQEPGEVFFTGLADWPFRIVLIDGHPVDMVLPEGVSWEPLDASLLGTLAAPEASGFVALNTAAFLGGGVLRVAAGVAVREPLALISTHSEDVAVHSRIVVVVGRGAALTLLEQHPEGDPGLVNGVMEIFIGENASLTHLKVVEGDASYQLSHTAVEIARSGRYFWTSLALSGNFTRNTMSVRLAGEGAETELRGLFLGRNQDLLDHAITVTHAAPNTRSVQLFKGILDGEAQGIFYGLVQILPGAKGADAQQRNPNLLLSPGAVIHTRPQLIIDHDAVHASHGATVGQLDEAAVFYAQSRGIDRADAERMLHRAFALEVIEALPEGELRDAASAWVDAWLENA